MEKLRSCQVEMCAVHTLTLVPSDAGRVASRLTSSIWILEILPTPSSPTTTIPWVCSSNSPPLPFPRSTSSCPGWRSNCRRCFLLFVVALVLGRASDHQLPRKI
jgi:hypothetical protein